MLSLSAGAVTTILPRCSVLSCSLSGCRLSNCPVSVQQKCPPCFCGGGVMLELCKLEDQKERDASLWRILSAIFLLVARSWEKEVETSLSFCLVQTITWCRTAAARTSWGRACFQFPLCAQKLCKPQERLWCTQCDWWMASGLPASPSHPRLLSCHAPFCAPDRAFCFLVLSSIVTPRGVFWFLSSFLISSAPSSLVTRN